MREILPKCPVEVALTLLNNKWTMLIIRDLRSGVMRFGELRKSIGKVSPTILTNNLRSMEQDGLITKHIYSEIPPHTDYTLTPLGESLIPIIIEMEKWGGKFKGRTRQ